MAKNGKRAGGKNTSRAYSWAIVALLRVPLILPYRMRLEVVAWLMAYVVSPLAGYDRRIRDNLAHACPDLPEAEIRRLIRQVPANTGRMLIEISSGEAFMKRLSGINLQGPGLTALDAATAEHRPVVVVSGHLGNGEAARFLLAKHGLSIGVLYRPVDDPTLDYYFNESMSRIAKPVFPRGRRGLGQMLRFLRKGNAVALLIDQYVNRGAPLKFFGKTAPTSLSAAEMALKYNALLVPIYALRRGNSFEAIVEEPIPHSDPMTMTQCFNDSLELQVRANMDQWLWIHRRWKPDRQRKAAAAKMRR